jgi:hypothetical protein
MNDLKKGSIVKLKDGYRIYADNELCQYYFTNFESTAKNLSDELTIKENKI